MYILFYNHKFEGILIKLNNKNKKITLAGIFVVQTALFASQQSHFSGAMSSSCVLAKETLNNAFSYKTEKIFINSKEEKEMVDFLQDIKKKERFNEEDREKFFKAIEDVGKILDEEETMLNMALKSGEEVLVIGDIHANVAALEDVFKNFLKKRNEGKNVKIVFLGDYGDRGFQGPDNRLNTVKTWWTILELKKRFPDNFFTIRGNHETSDISGAYGGLDSFEAMFDRDAVSDVERIFYEKIVKGFFEKLHPCGEITLPNGEKTFFAHGCIPVNCKDSKRMLEELKKSKDKSLPFSVDFSLKYFGGNLNDKQKIMYGMNTIGNQLFWNDFSEESLEDAPNYKRSANGDFFVVGRRSISDFCKENNYNRIISAHNHSVSDGQKTFKFKNGEDAPRTVDYTITMCSPNMNYNRNAGHILIIDSDNNLHDTKVKYDLFWKDFKGRCFDPNEKQIYYQWIKTEYINKIKKY